MNTDDQATKSSRRSRSGRSRSSRAQPTRKKGWKALIAPLLVVVLVAGACLLYLWNSEPVNTTMASAGPAEPGKKSPERTAALAPLNLPADDAPHGTGMEWWYYNGILDAKTGNRYAFHVAVFVANGLIKHTVMHVAWTDLQTGKRRTSQTRTAGTPTHRAAEGFDFKQDGWHISASGPSHVLRGSFEGISIALDMTDAGLPVAHRAADSDTPGLLDFGKSGISYYYSRPRLSAQGEITVDGKPAQVSGKVWFDHQWGDFDVLTLGWNWFALHLADGSDLMLYELFDADGKKVMTAGTHSSASGSVPLKPGEVELIPGATWTSPKTRIPYVVEWGIKLPSGLLNIKPFQADSEFDSGGTSANVYWEGPVKVTGSAHGEGFLELSGYDRLNAAKSNRK